MLLASEDDSSWLWGVMSFGIRWSGLGMCLLAIPAMVIVGSILAGGPPSMAPTVKMCMLFYLHFFTQLFIVLRLCLQPLAPFIWKTDTPPNLLPSPSKIVTPKMKPDMLSKVLKERRSFSFDGCSWLMSFHLGVATALVDAMGWKGVSQLHFCGSSCGSLIAVALACRVDLGQMREFVFEMLDVALVRFLGPIGTMTAFVKGGLVSMLPENAHDLASGRLWVSLSALCPQPKNVRASAWASRQELIACCLASCYIPIYYEEPVEFQGHVGVDGGLTDNQPVTDANTVTVSPWAHGEALIRPSQTYPASFSIVPGSREDMEAIYWDGYGACVAWMAGEGWLSSSDSFALLDEDEAPH
mmetsp:Transcript_37901/g.89671  ORF Transcript_37901/g.89671 Transcript_37901/m.89671 type:complete len:356 (-) Transcript_37901:19-1086(-)